MLCVTRPPSSKSCTGRFSKSGDVVETNSFGSLPIVLAEYQIADAPKSSPVPPPASQRRLPALLDCGSQRLLAGSLGRHEAPTLGQVKLQRASGRL